MIPTEVKTQTRLSPLGKVWQLRPRDENQIHYISQRFNLPDLLSTLTFHRCPDPDRIHDYLHPTLNKLLPHPFSLKDMERGVSRLLRAIQNKERVTVFGDYDVDGACSSALFVHFFRRIGHAIDFYIPDRQAEGYGPNIPALDRLKAQGTQVIILVDCGTTAHEALAHAQRIGLDVIVVDHHIPEATLPPAIAVINPNRTDDQTVPTLCAAGVSFLVLVGLQYAIKEQKLPLPLPDLKEFLDLVAVATVCDVVPLVHLNRAFVVQGLKVLNKGTNPGLRALVETNTIQGPLTAYHLGYILGPRINAGGRVGASTLGTELLTATDPETLTALAAELNQLNQERQRIEKEILEQALIDAETTPDVPFLMIVLPEAHIGVIGIIAGRLKERFNKPSLVISVDAKGIGKGSGRSVGNVHLGDLMTAAKDAGLLINGGGHAMAAGFTVHRDQLNAFREFLIEKLQDHTPDITFPIDECLSLASVHPDTVQLIDQLRPFGAGNATPVFMILNCAIRYPKIRGDKHISCVLVSEAGHRVDAIAFGAVGTPLEPLLLSGATCDVVGTLQIDTWQGRQTVKVSLSDLIQ